MEILKKLDVVICLCANVQMCKVIAGEGNSESGNQQNTDLQTQSRTTRNTIAIATMIKIIHHDIWPEMVGPVTEEAPEPLSSFSLT